MQSYEVIGGPLAEPAIWRGALFWALALYIPLSGPLARFEKSLDASPVPESGRQAVLIASSLLLAMAVGLVTQLMFSWTLGPGWASSLALIGIGWSLLLLLSDNGQENS
ncbi:MAG: hypothetical protein VX069_07030 [Cyanobacteriota bacterium]|uniref:hypothetical protein n=1 Tax=Synechococcus sp. KORDI-100 TaxID=1280380 RepID=UPI0004E0476D|nr:hypothetical protein [Synechococcus sp. KORDI-100]AII42193.1 hypothetical protein KR100_02080 [Synechococcus sp. KORDI-100]MEC8214804.1 hypothetical protein [Cyanobacteriota bacterium]